MTDEARPAPDEERVAPPARVEGGSAAWRRSGRIVLGIVFLVLGVAGLFLPFLQGILFLAIGSALLAPDVPIARKGLLVMYRRWPRVRRAVPRRFRRIGRDDPPPPGACDGVGNGAGDGAGAPGEP